MPRAPSPEPVERRSEPRPSDGNAHRGRILAAALRGWKSLASDPLTVITISGDEPVDAVMTSGCRAASSRCRRAATVFHHRAAATTRSTVKRRIDLRSAPERALCGGDLEMTRTERPGLHACWCQRSVARRASRSTTRALSAVRIWRISIGLARRTRFIPSSATTASLLPSTRNGQGGDREFTACLCGACGDAGRLRRIRRRAWKTCTVRNFSARTATGFMEITWASKRRRAGDEHAPDGPFPACGTARARHMPGRTVMRLNRPALGRLARRSALAVAVLAVVAGAVCDCSTGWTRAYPPPLDQRRRDFGGGASTATARCCGPMRRRGRAVASSGADIDTLDPQPFSSHAGRL